MERDDIPKVTTLPAIKADSYGKPGAGGIEAAIHKRQRQQELLEVYTETLNLPKACRKAGIDWMTHEAWAANDSAYRRALKAADRLIGRIVEAGEIDRTVNGVPKPNFFEGEQCGTTVEHDPRRAQTILRAKLPDEYGAKLEVDIKSRSEADLRARLAFLLDSANAQPVVDAEIVPDRPDEDGPPSIAGLDGSSQPGPSHDASESDPTPPRGTPG